MRTDQYESIIESLIELIHLQNRRIKDLELTLELVQIQTDQKIKDLQARRSLKIEDSKFKVFMDVFDGLSRDNGTDIEEKKIVMELIKTGKFTEDEAYNYLKKAMQIAQIYERKTGVYAKA